LQSYSEIDYIEIDRQLSIKPMTDYSTVPHLHMDGNSYIQLPSMTYTAIELDCIIDKTINNTASRYIFDNRTDGISYFYSNSSNLEVFFNCNVYIDGVLHTDGAAANGTHSSIVTSGVRTTIRIELSSVATASTLLFTRSGLGFGAYGDIFTVKVYNSANVVASYDMSTGTVSDQTGNGHNAALTGGQWVALNVAPPVKESFSNYEGGLQWGLLALRAKDYWDRGITGEGLKVSVLDVGFPHHYYYTKDYVDGVDYSSTTDYHLPGNSGLVHGLEVSSQVDSDVIYSNAGVHSGIARNIDIYAVKTYDGDAPTTTQVISSINWTMSKGIQVINFSSLISDYGTGDTAVFAAIDSFVNNDGVLFMSSGNFREETTTAYINSYPKITLVGGINNQFKRFDDGNTGSNFSQNLSFMTVYGT
jgi:hypothetical protein